MTRFFLILLTIAFSINVHCNTIINHFSDLRTKPVIDNTLKLGLAYYQLKGLNVTIDTLAPGTDKNIITRGRVQPIDDSTYIIYLSNINNLDSLIRNLFHEITHLSQLVRKELLIYDDHFLYKGTKFKKTAYFSAPWEEEAILMSDVLFTRFYIMIYNNKPDKIIAKINKLYR